MASGVFRFEDIAPTGLRRFRLYYARNRPTIHLGLLVAAFLFVAAAPWIFVSVPAGHVGVMWYRLQGGTDTGTPHGEGLRLVFPWDRLEIYDARVQQISRDFEVLTKDGMAVSVSIAWQFRIREGTAGLLHKYVGPHYVETLLAPAVSSHTRHVFSQNSTDEAYTARRSQVQDEIRLGVLAELEQGIRRSEPGGAPWIILENILIRGMRFPAEVEAAINRKMEQYQLRQEYAYRLEREQLESERKAVEADGIARFQRIVGAGISENYLRWKGIDATLALARSPNAKVVVIGTPKDGMPLILGGGDARPAETATEALPGQGQRAVEGGEAPEGNRAAGRPAAWSPDLPATPSGSLGRAGD